MTRVHTKTAFETAIEQSFLEKANTFNKFSTLLQWKYK